MGSNLSSITKDELYNSIIPIAKEFRNSFIAENEVINDTFETVERLGFFLLRFPAHNKNRDLSGFYIEKKPYNCIYINSTHSLGRQYLSVWHEVYHAITKEGNSLSYASNTEKDPIEYKADSFAGCILMPEKLVKAFVVNNHINLDYIKYTDIIAMQNYFSVSYSAMVTRLIRVYPDKKNILSTRYNLGNNNEKQIKRLTELTLQVNGNLKLIQPTNDIFIPNELFDDIEYNLENNRISKEKAYEILSLIDSLSDD